MTSVILDLVAGPAAPLEDAVAMEIAGVFVSVATMHEILGELRHFTERFGVDALIDREGRRFKDLGLASTPQGDGRWIERLLAEPLLLRQPLVRAQNRFTIGLAEGEWKDWVDK